MSYEDSPTVPGTDPEVFELSYERKDRHRMSMIINTPIGHKKIRANQLSVDTRFLFVHDMLRQQRWVAISSIQQHDGLIYTCSTAGTAVALKPTTFLEPDL